MLFFPIKAISCYVHVRKPDPKIFQYALDAAKVKGEEAVYVEDREDRIEGAAALGLKIIIFKDLEQFKKDLELMLEKQT